MKNTKHFLIFSSLLLPSCAYMQPSLATKPTVFYSNASVADYPACLNMEPRDLELACHRLRKDKNILLAVRSFRSSPDHHSDNFRKITIQLPQTINPGATYAIDGNTRAFLSYGLTYGLGKNGCYGSGKSGNVHIISVESNKIVAKIDLIFTMESPLKWPNRCKEETYSELITAQYKPYESLTAWDGIYQGRSNEVQEAHP